MGVTAARAYGAGDRVQVGRLVATVLIAVVVLLGWRELWFLTDDAFITFRYISNRRLGLGYVWNAPPFHAVEGYTNFLWMILLDAVWSLFGVEPPVASTVLSLGLGYGTLWQSRRILAGLPWPPSLERARAWIAWIAVLGIALNRTFLTWLSSGLETSLFTFCTVWWVAASLRLARKPGPGPLAVVCAAATLAALTRPDGILFVAASLVLACWTAIRGVAPGARLAWAVAPLLGVPLHLAWRRFTYGDWLPNTYYAKHVAAWPEAGWRYLASFLLENAFWAPLLVATWALARTGVRDGRRAVALVVTAALTAHVGYYTLVIGGDHFEYRVFAHLVPLVFVAAVWAVTALAWPPVPAVGFTAAVVALSLPIPWVHHFRARHVPWPQANRFVLPVADMLPAVARPYARAFDSLQAWLIPHFVGNRRQEHEAFYEWQVREHPPRSVGAALGGPGLPILAEITVGVPGWVFPRLYIVDEYGLNDRVVARTPLTPARLAFRHMAHDRWPPAGYLECLRPNVEVVRRQVVVSPRPDPFTAADIALCEERFMRSLESASVAAGQRLE